MTLRRALLGLLALVLVSAAAFVGYSVATRVIPEDVPAQPATFGDVMRPMKTSVVSPEDADVRFRDSEPRWGDLEEIGWDEPGAFTYSLGPHANGTYREGRGGGPSGRTLPSAEFFMNNSVPKNADVTFTVKGRQFAIHYVTADHSDAMVWIDGQRASVEPFVATGRQGTGSDSWIEITLPKVRSVEIRFAGPLLFSGVAHPRDEQIVVKAAPPRFTIGVVSDSFYELNRERRSLSSSGALVLSTLTGFRTWNMAQGGTGYLNGGDEDTPGFRVSDLSGTSAYGSDERLDDVANAPIDALLVNGSINDYSLFSPAEYRHAVDRFLTMIEMRRPTMPIVLVGIEPLSRSGLPDEPIEEFVAMTETLKDMATDHRNVVGFIDPYTPNWLTGTGSTAKPRGDGNQDQYIGEDGWHPNGAGQVFYQMQIISELRKLPMRRTDPR
ncbi:MAG: SGNH/GDSL hydrolase family protein [Aeromicrobium sp.]